MGPMGLGYSAAPTWQHGCLSTMNHILVQPSFLRNRRSLLLHSVQKRGRSLSRERGAPLEVLHATGPGDDGGYDVENLRLKRLWGGLFGAGFVLGPLMDGIHSAAKLLKYELAAVDLGPLHTSATVPFLLGTFYCVVGVLVFFLDEKSPPPSPVGTSLQTAGLCFASTTALLALSSVLFVSSYAFSTISVALCALGLAQWAYFDRSLQGLGLSLACSILAPVSELILMHYLHVWYYPRADWIAIPEDLVYSGFPTFVPWCYFFYTTWVVTLARSLKVWSEEEPDTEGKRSL